MKLVKSSNNKENIFWTFAKESRFLFSFALYWKIETPSAYLLATTSFQGGNSCIFLRTLHEVQSLALWKLLKHFSQASHYKASIG